MKIGITAFPSLGGSGMLATRLAIELAKRDHEVHFISYSRPIALVEEQKNFILHKVDIETYALFQKVGTLYTINLASALARIAKQNRLKVVNSHYGLPHAISAFLAKSIYPFSSAITLHGSETHLFGRSLAFGEILGMSLRRSESVVAVSKFLAKLAEEVFGLERSPQVIYDFIDTQQFTPGPEEREKVIVHASNFREIKNIPFLVDVFSRVAADFPDWKLRLIGAGPERPKVIRQVRLLGIKEQVEFIDPIKEIPEAFGQASILANTSKVESFGLTIGEGMSCKTPVWAARTGGIPEVCEDGKTGLLYVPGDIEDAESKLRKLMENESLRKKMGEAARKRILEKFSVSTIVGEYLKMYENLNSH